MPAGRTFINRCLAFDPLSLVGPTRVQLVDFFCSSVTVYTKIIKSLLSTIIKILINPVSAAKDTKSDSFHQFHLEA